MSANSPGRGGPGPDNSGLGRSAVQTIVVGLISDTVLEIAFGISVIVGRIFESLNNALRQGGAAVARPFRAGGSSAIEMVGSVGAFVLDLSGAAGPAAPLVAVVVVAIVVGVIGTGVRLVIGVII